MGLLEGKKAVIFGVANDRSIAWAISEAFHAEGAELAFTYAGEVLKSAFAPWLKASEQKSFSLVMSPKTKKSKRSSPH